MAREKKPVHKVQMTEGKRNIIRQLLKSMTLNPHHPLVSGQIHASLPFDKQQPKMS